MTSKTMTRSDFLRLSAGFVGSTALLGTFGCPGDDSGGEEGANDSTTGSATTDEPETTTGPQGSTSNAMTDTDASTGEPGDSSTTAEPPADSGSETGPGSCDTDPDVTIGTNHGHEMVVPLADVMAGVEVVYDIQGTSVHAHFVTLTAEHFAALATGASVMVQSSSSGHTHEVTVTCG